MNWSGKIGSPSSPALSADLVHMLEVTVHGLARSGLRSEADIGEFVASRNAEGETTIHIPLPRDPEDKSAFCEAIANARFLMPRVGTEEDLNRLILHPREAGRITLHAHSPAIMTQALETLGKAVEARHPEIGLSPEDREAALYYLENYRQSQTARHLP